MAVPKRQVCSIQNLSTGTKLGRAPTSTPRIIPRSTTEALDTSPIQEEFDGIGFNLESYAQTGNVKPTGNNQQIQQTLESPLAGGIYFAPVRTSSVSPKVSVITISTTSGTAQVLPHLSTQVPQTTGSIITSLNKSGQPTSAPIISTSISKPTTTLSPTSKPSIVTTSVLMGSTSENIFQPVETNAPASVIGSRPDHPVPRLGIQPQQAPISTNKFYANFFLGSQTSGTWIHPYSIAWSKGGGSTQSWGM